MTNATRDLLARCASVFPRIARSLSIHLTPGQSYVRTGITPAGDSTEKKGFWVVNHDAARLLEACDGSHSIPDLLSTLAVAPDAENLLAACTFLVAAEEQGHLVFEAEPAPGRTARRTGTTRFHVPIHISVELTSRCNLACTYCYNDYEGGGEEELGFEELCSLLEEWRAWGLTGVEITGGEPLLHPEIREILAWVLGSFRDVALLTNGTLLDDDTADFLARWKDTLRLGISLDGPDAATHEALSRIPGSFDGALAGIRRAVERDLWLRVSMAVTPQNVFRIEETLLLARRCGARYFSYSPVVPFGRGVDLAWGWDPAQAVEIAEMEQRLAREYAGFLTVLEAGLLGDLGQANCGAGYKNVVVSPRGKVRSCLFLPESDSFGDLRLEPLEMVLRKPVVSYMGNLPKPRSADCASCRYALYCGDCLVRPLAVFAREERLCYWGHENDVPRWFGLGRELLYDPERPTFA